jgi:hypothetical protein
LTLLGASGLRGQCADPTTLMYTSTTATRTSANQVKLMNQTSISGDYYNWWRPESEVVGYFASTVESSTGWQLDPYTGGTWSNWWSPTLQTYGAGTYSVSAWADAWTSYCGGSQGLTLSQFCNQNPTGCTIMPPWNTGNSIAIQRPAVVGPNNQAAVSAFWYLGGIAQDQGYYAQAQWVAQPNGATGTPAWQWNYYGSGGVYLSCTSCSSVVATSASASLGCTADIKITLNYGGFTSNPFWVTIVSPSITTLEAGYPQDTKDGPGYKTYYQWALTDACHNEDPGLDANETFGDWTDDYLAAHSIANNWPAPPAIARNILDATCYDTIGAYGSLVPTPEIPQNPLSNQAVKHDFPWHYFVGSLSFGSGLSIISDTQQWYLDHGRHF